MRLGESFGGNFVFEKYRRNIGFFVTSFVIYLDGYLRYIL